MCLCRNCCEPFQQRRIKPEAWTQTIVSERNEIVDVLAGMSWHTRVNGTHVFMSLLLSAGVSVKQLWLRLLPRLLSSKIKARDASVLYVCITPTTL